MINNQTEYRSRYDVEYVVDERTSASAQLVVTSKATQVYPGMHLCIKLKYQIPAAVLPGMIEQTLQVNLADGTSVTGQMIRTSSSGTASDRVSIPEGYLKAGAHLNVTAAQFNNTSVICWVIDDFTEMVHMPTATDSSLHSIAFRTTAQSSGADSNGVDGVSSSPKIAFHPNNGILSFPSQATGYSVTSHGQSIDSPFQSITMSNKFLRYNGTITPNSGTLNVGTVYYNGNSNIDVNNIVAESYGSSPYTWMDGDWLIDSSLNVFQNIQHLSTTAVMYRGKLNIDLSSYVTSSDLTTALADYVTTTYLTTNYSTTATVQTMIDTAIGNAIGASY